VHGDGAARRRGGLDLDVATGGELHVALHAGSRPSASCFHGNNKSSGELRAALDAGVGRIVVDSFDELDGSSDSRRAATRRAVLVRVTPGVEAHTHEYIETGTDDSKFGFGCDRRCAARGARVAGRRAAARRTALPHRVAGVPSRFVRGGVGPHGRLVLAVETETARPSTSSSVGGGLGVRYVASDEGPSIAQFAAALQESFAKALAAHGVRSGPRSVSSPAARSPRRPG
jgi:diaminopimelate decarboxylase